MGVIEEEIAKLKKQQDLVLRQLLAYRQKARTEIEPGDKVLLEEKAKQYEEQYEDLSKKIERLERDEPPELTEEVLSRFRAELHKAWGENLYWLDYFDQEDWFRARVKRQVAVLLFIQHGLRMKAELYIKRIRQRVLDDGRLRPFIEDFSIEGRVNPEYFIECLRSKLNIHPASLESETGVQQIIQTLQRAVLDGQTLYLDIRLKEVSENFLGWLREQFWQPLVEPLLRPHRHIRVIVILTTEAALPKGHLRVEWCCKSTQFDHYKYCEIKLPKWQQMDIECWMSAYLNGSLCQRHLPAQDSPALAQQVCDSSEKGVPLHAYNYILGDLLTHLVKQLPEQSHVTS